MRQTLRKLNTWLFALLAAGLLLVLTAPVSLAAEASGQCGDNLTWSVDAGTLAITGSGAMWDFTDDSMAPWYEYRENILRLSLPDGLTAVGDLAFYDCMNLQTVSIPGSVASIGDYAFASCDGLVMLGLGTGLEDIGTGSFYGCWSLTSARLPRGLETIGSDAFYDCRSLTSVTLPASVASVGSAAFAYCTSLVRAEVQSELTTLPDWTFFGCSMLSTVILPDSVGAIGGAAFRDCGSLSSVSYGGDNMSMDELQKTIAADAPVFGSTGSLTEAPPEGPAFSGTAVENPDGTVTEESTCVTEGEHASVSATLVHTHGRDSLSGGELSSDITVTVEHEDGWEEALAGVRQALSRMSGRAQPDTTVDPASVNVYVTGSGRVDQGFVDAVAGQNVQMTVTTRNGSSWKMDMSQMTSEERSGQYDLSCVLSGAGQELCEELGVADAFLLRFNASAQVNAEVLVYLGQTWARQNATLFQRVDSELVRRQTVVVDGQGFAHLYLASVREDTEYYIAMDLSASEEEVILPEELLGEYNAVRYEPIQYEITGRTSSWGMNIRQVTWIMVGVLVFVVAGVGVTMFLLNKRKLKLGYVPDLDGEE